MNESPRLSEGLLLAGLTLGGYSVAFAHEAGYAGYFGVPFGLISLDITRVLVAIAAVLGLAWLLYIFLNPLMAFLVSSSWPEPIRERIFQLAFPLVALFAYSYVGDVSRQMFIAFIVLTVIGGAGYFLLPLATQRKIRGYVKKLEAESKREGPTPSQAPINDALIRVIGQATYNRLVLCAIVVFAAFGIGRGQATKQEWFYTPSDSVQVVLVGTYGATMIGAKYDPNTKHLRRGLVVGMRGEQPWTELVWSKVGRLSGGDTEITR